MCKPWRPIIGTALHTCIAAPKHVRRTEICGIFLSIWGNSWKCWRTSVRINVLGWTRQATILQSKLPQYISVLHLTGHTAKTVMSVPITGITDSFNELARLFKHTVTIIADTLHVLLPWLTPKNDHWFVADYTSQDMDTMHNHMGP